MGFLDFCCSVGGAILDAGKAIWNGAKAAVGAVAKIGSAVMMVAKPLVHALCVVAPQLGLPLLGVLRIADTVVKTACVATGLMDAAESVLGVGEKALEAAEQGIKIEDYDNPRDYLDAIRDIPPAADPNKWTDEEKSIAGISTLAYALEKKFNISPEVYPLFVRYHKFFTPEREKAYIDYALETGYDLADLQDYFGSNATIGEKDAALGFMLKAEEAAKGQSFDAEKFEEHLLEVKMGNATPNSEIM